MSELIGSCMVCGLGVPAFKTWLDPALVIDHTQRGVCERCFNAAMQNVRLLAALQVVLDQVDYTAGACTVTEMVGAVLSKEVIKLAKEAIAATPNPRVTPEQNALEIAKAALGRAIMVFRGENAPDTVRQMQEAYEAVRHSLGYGPDPFDSEVISGSVV